MTDYVAKFKITQVMAELERKYPSPWVGSNGHVDYYDYVPAGEPLLDAIAQFRKAVRDPGQRNRDANWDKVFALLKSGAYQNEVSKQCGISYANLRAAITKDKRLEKAYHVGVSRRLRLVIEYPNGRQVFVGGVAEAAKLLNVSTRAINFHLQDRNQNVPKYNGRWKIKHWREFQADGGMGCPAKQQKGSGINGSVDIAKTAGQNRS